MASWSGDDGLIDTSVPTRPGILNFYIVHTVKINVEFHQHAFAVVRWYKTDRDQGHFGTGSRHAGQIVMFLKLFALSIIFQCFMADASLNLKRKMCGSNSSISDNDLKSPKEKKSLR